jgi:hypothetical protein
MTSPNEHRLWYVRRKRDVRGPFPTAVISQFLLLGRLSKNDEVSIDQQEWRHIADVTELQPEVMKADLTESANQSNLEAARRGADERDVGDRRQLDDPEHVDQRKGERRAVESEKMRAHREQRAAQREAQMKKDKTQQFLILSVMLVLVFAGLGVVVYKYQPSQEQGAMDCSADPAPGVNWSNCNFQGSSLNGVDLSRALIRNTNLSNVSLYRAKLTGADLAYANLGLANLRMSDLNKALLTGATLRGADLRGADLRGADLSYADLRGAQLAGVSLEGAKLDKTIWTDGGLCAQGSVGGCQPAKANSRATL